MLFSTFFFETENFLQLLQTRASFGSFLNPVRLKLHVRVHNSVLGGDKHEALPQGASFLHHQRFYKFGFKMVNFRLHHRAPFLPVFLLGSYQATDLTGGFTNRALTPR